MKIKVIKHTPYRRCAEREIMPEEIHEVVSIRPQNGNLQSKAFYINVDGRKRMLLETDCIIVEK